MNLAVVGINHTSAPVAIRERVAFAPEQMEEALQDAQTFASLNGVVILSTCNRTEIILTSNLIAQAAELISQWLAEYHHVSYTDIQSCLYTYTKEEALKHITRVASGLDSMVLGEPQIFGQLKSAFAVAQVAGTLCGLLNPLFQHVFATAKRVRTDTAVGQHPVSVAYAAVKLSEHIYSDLTRLNVLLIGAGEMVRLVAQHLSEKNVKSMVIANRTLHSARELAENFSAEAILLSEIPDQLAHADIVVTCTGSQLPILGKGAVERALKLRRHRPILIVDIAVPRDVEPEVAELNDVYLYTVDDLQQIIEGNVRAREAEAAKADELINESLLNWQVQLKSQDAVDTVKELRQWADDIRQDELLKAKKALDRGERPEAVIDSLSRSMMNKLIHTPSVTLRQAGAEGRHSGLGWARELFGLSSEPSTTKDKNNG